MNERIKDLIAQSTELKEIKCEGYCTGKPYYRYEEYFDKEKFAELLIESVLDQVGKRAYYTGDRDWSDEVDRPWIQLEFGYGKLYDAKHFGVVK